MPLEGGTTRFLDVKKHHDIVFVYLKVDSMFFDICIVYEIIQRNGVTKFLIYTYKFLHRIQIRMAGW